MKIAIVGASGRMGQAVARAAHSEKVAIVGAIVSRNSRAIGRDVGELAGIGPVGVVASSDIAAGLLGADVAVDFSIAAAMPAFLHVAMRARVPIVSGTTQLDQACSKLLDEAARVVPVLWAPNTSIGVHVLAEIAAEAVRRLGPSFDIEIVEAHHRGKVDAPSGTANRLREVLTQARGDGRAVTGREGVSGPRRDDEIGVFAMRGGDVIGDHTVHLLGPGERLELTHRATSRDLFARGALHAARFLVGKPPGRYHMADVVAAKQ